MDPIPVPLPNDQIVVQPPTQTPPRPQESTTPQDKPNYLLYIIIALILIIDISASVYFFILKPTNSSLNSTVMPTLVPVPTSISEESTSPSAEISSSQTNPTPSIITCLKDDQNCILTNVVNSFTSACRPVEVSTPVDEGQVVFTLSPGENGACRFQMKGLGADQDCLFLKENVTQKIIKGMLGMDNIPNDPEFIKIKDASCK